METALVVDPDAIAAVCRARGVSRLRLFGSATTGEFDAARSDVDLLVEFGPDATDLFDSYFGLKEDFEKLWGRPVDIVMADAVTNPHFARSAFATARDLYAA
jgi:uncharacterized protein